MSESDEEVPAAGQPALGVQAITKGQKLEAVLGLEIAWGPKLLEKGCGPHNIAEVCVSAVDEALELLGIPDVEDLEEDMRANEAPAQLQNPARKQRRKR